MPTDNRFNFTPKEDITAYELAMLFAGTSLSLNAQLFGALPPEVKRHFTEVNVLGEPVR